MPLNHKKERCRAKAKAKAKAKATRTSFFFGLDVFFGVWLFPFFYLVTLAILLSIVGQWQLIRTGPNVCCVPVLIRAKDPFPRTDAIYLARIRI
jgi:hypothetical protein